MTTEFKTSEETLNKFLSVCMENNNKVVIVFVDKDSKLKNVDTSLLNKCTIVNLK